MGDVRTLAVVDIRASLLDGAPRVALRLGESGEDERVENREVACFEAFAREFLTRHVGEDRDEFRVGKRVDFGAEEDFRRFERGVNSLLAVRERREFFRDLFLEDALSEVRAMFFDQRV